MAVDTTTRVFLCYRREDTRHLAGRLADRLTQHFGEVFMDIDDIEPGTDFTTAIRDAVGECDVLLALIGPQWLNAQDKKGKRRLDNPADWIVEEIRVALERDIRVIPVLVDSAVMPDREELPTSLSLLANRHAVTLRHESFAVDVAALTTIIERTMALSGTQSRSVTPVLAEPGKVRELAEPIADRLSTDRQQQEWAGGGTKAHGASIPAQPTTASVISPAGIWAPPDYYAVPRPEQAGPKTLQEPIGELSRMSLSPPKRPTALWAALGCFCLSLTVLAIGQTGTTAQTGTWIFCGLYLLFALIMLVGRNWSRITATVFAVLLPAFMSLSTLPPAIWGIAGVLVALGVGAIGIVFVYRARSNRYFKEHKIYRARRLING